MPVRSIRKSSRGFAWCSVRARSRSRKGSRGGGRKLGREGERPEKDQKEEYEGDSEEDKDYAQEEGEEVVASSDMRDRSAFREIVMPSGVHIDAVEWRERGMVRIAIGASRRGC